MANGIFPIQVTVEDRAGRIYGKGEIKSRQDECSFTVRSAGTYLAKGSCANGLRVRSDEISLKSAGVIVVRPIDFLPPSSLNGDQQKAPPQNKPPWKAITTSAIGISLLSNFGGAEPLIREIARQLADDVPPPRSSPQNQPRNNPQSRTPPSQARYDRLFSPSVEARLRDCIQSNIVRLSGIPTLSSLLESLSWEREPSGEFERQLIFAYTRYQEVKALFEKCDPTLIQEILAAQEEVTASGPQFQETAFGTGESTPNFQAQATVTVIGSFINIRVGPSTQNAILGQVTYGTVLGVNQEILALLSPSERLAISEGRGWLTIFIPDGRSGYIYSLYITPRPSF